MKDKKIILCIICLVAILSIIIAFGVSQKDNAKDKTNKENQNNMQIELQEGSKIDVKNLENAKIENGMKVNNSPKAQEEKIVENLKYSEFSMDSKNEESNFRLRVTNIGKEKTTLNDNFKIIFSLKLFGIITWLKLKFDKKKLEKVKYKIKIDKNKIRK